MTNFEYMAQSPEILAKVAVNNSLYTACEFCACLPLFAASKDDYYAQCIENMTNWLKRRRVSSETTNFEYITQSPEILARAITQNGSCFNCGICERLSVREICNDAQCVECAINWLKQEKEETNSD